MTASRRKNWQVNEVLSHVGLHQPVWRLKSKRKTHHFNEDRLQSRTSFPESEGNFYLPLFLESGIQSQHA